MRGRNYSLCSTLHADAVILDVLSATLTLRSLQVCPLSAHHQQTLQCWLALSNRALGNAVSCGTRPLGEAVELDEQFFPVPGGEFGDVLNKGGDLLTVGLAEVLGAAELGGVLLD